MSTQGVAGSVVPSKKPVGGTMGITSRRKKAIIAELEHASGSIAHMVDRVPFMKRQESTFSCLGGDSTEHDQPKSFEDTNDSNWLRDPSVNPKRVWIPRRLSSLDLLDDGMVWYGNPHSKSMEHMTMSYSKSLRESRASSRPMGRLGSLTLS